MTNISYNYDSKVGRIIFSRKKYASKLDKNNDLFFNVFLKLINKNEKFDDKALNLGSYAEDISKVSL